MESNVRAHVFISGSVQGVFFRMETMRTANRLAVLGWVRNRSNGTVEAVFEGDRTQVDAMLSWCKKGPSHARVAGVKIDWEKYAGELTRFDVTY